MGDQGGERDPGLDWKRANVLLGTGGTHTAESILGWGPQIVQDLVELVNVISALEDWLSEEELCENAPHRPNVDGGRVVGETQHNFWRSIPSSGNIFSHEALVGTSLGVGTSPGGVASGETEVADFELAVGINQEVTRLEITMDDVRRMNVLRPQRV